MPNFRPHFSTAQVGNGDTRKKHFTLKELQSASEYRRNLRVIKKSLLRLMMCARLN